MTTTPTRDPGPPNHLRQIDEATVAALYARVRPLAIDSYTVLAEANAFHESRTPHDATRLANALEHYDPPVTPEMRALITELDQAAEDCAGLVPANRQRRGKD